MKCRLIKLAMLLLLGAAINVAVAWGCLALEQPRGHHATFENLGLSYTWGQDPRAGFPVRSIRLPTSAQDRLAPLWPGFAINTLFYAAACWLLFAAPFAVRREHRRRRGRCVRCGYDLRGRPDDAAACPECGGADG